MSNIDPIYLSGVAASIRNEVQPSDRRACNEIVHMLDGPNSQYYNVNPYQGNPQTYYGAQQNLEQIVKRNFW